MERKGLRKIAWIEQERHEHHEGKKIQRPRQGQDLFVGRMLGTDALTEQKSQEPDRAANHKSFVTHAGDDDPRGLLKMGISRDQIPMEGVIQGKIDGNFDGPVCRDFRPHDAPAFPE